MSSVPPIQGLCEVYPDRIEPEHVRAANEDGARKIGWYNTLRARLKHEYLLSRQGTFGRDIKDYWTSDRGMAEVADVLPVLCFHRSNLRPLCNKPTMLYWELSAQNTGSHSCCPGYIFACIYKFWFRLHDNAPEMGFEKFFAHPIRITEPGPQTIPEIVKTHAHLCDTAASHLNMVKGCETGNYSIERSRWQNFHLFPLCRAIIVVLDELVSPLPRMDDTISLDDQVRRQTAVLVLTGYHQDLSSEIDFDTIRAESLPLARRDVSATDSANMIRVSLKTAVQFITKLQQREERAFSSSRRGSTKTTLESHPSAISKTLNDADDYVKNILANPTESRSWSKIQHAFGIMKAIQKGEMDPEFDFGHWSPRWI